MPPQLLVLLEKIKTAAKGIADSIFIIYAEKGFEPFKRPGAIATAVLLVIYSIVYSPVTSRVAQAKAKVQNMKVVSQYAEDYESAKMRLSGFQSKLPRNEKDAKDEWLKRIINDSARKVGVSVDSLGAQSDTEVGNYVVVSRDVTATISYGTLGRWLAEIENSTIFLRITTMSLTRDESAVGFVKVQFTLSTIFQQATGKK